MRKWGILTTVFYALVLLLILQPLAYVLAVPLQTIEWNLDDWSWTYEFWWATALWGGVLIVGQALLLFVSVDTSFRRLRPRRHVAVSVATVALMVSLLFGFAIWSLIVAYLGDDALGTSEDEWAAAFWTLVGLLWLIWTAIFYFYRDGKYQSLDRLMHWLIRGSILELLIAVPCHVIVRHREDCSAPIVTGYGISTGIAVMLLAFGPGVLFLYKKRLAEYKSRA